MKRTHFFTLTELLVVIAIIGVLAGVALPVISTAANKGKQTKARTDIHSLEIAFSEFERDFGSIRALPGIGSFPALNSNDRQLVNPINSVNSTRDYDGTMETLTYTLYDGKAASNNIQGSGNKTLAAANPRKKAYFRAPPKKVQDPLVTSGTYKDGYFILDPWGHRYNIAFDYNGDNIINANGFGAEKGDVRGKILIFSYGHDKDDNFKNYICSWKRR